MISTLRAATPAFYRSKLYRAAHTQSHANHLNAPLDLDPSLRDLLRDADISLLRHQHVTEKPTPKELESWPVASNSALNSMQADESEPDGESEYLSARWKRKSPQARFGSSGLASIVIPVELQQSINRLIQESDKSLLRADAKRLFLQPLTSGIGNHGSAWKTDTPKYSSPRNERVAAPRDGLAFAALSIPPHFVTLSEVFAQLKIRFGNDWKVENIVDFGSQVGSALWASLYAFKDHSLDDERLAHTTVKRYLSLENRSGLNSIHRKLMRDIATGDCTVSYKKWWREFDEEVVQQIRQSPDKTVVVSAFNLSQMSTPSARKQYLHEMWSVGADTIIIVDQGNPAGFECIAEARDELLSIGKRAAEKGHKGNHVAAPCPHDHICPLRATKDSCFFTQRLQRPDFLRKTKHALRGHEDTTYSYVVIRRGERPAAMTKPMDTEAAMDNLVDAEEDDVHQQYDKDKSNVGLTKKLQADAYHWPRVIYPPLKRSGHIHLDVCTSDATIQRITIPRSQGKQFYYDARKSSWGDIFPHEPKNPGVVRTRGIRRLNEMPQPGDPSGKLGEYEKMAGELRSQKLSREKLKSRQQGIREMRKSLEENDRINNSF